MTTTPLNAERILERIGCLNRMPIRLEDIINEQVNRDLLDQFQTAIRIWADSYFTAEAVNAANPDHSADKIRRDLIPIQQRSNAAFNQLCDRCRTLQQLHIAKVNKIESSTDTAPAGDAVLLFLQCQEIRAYLRSLPVPERLQLLINSDDYQIVSAIQSAPSCLEILPQDLLDRGTHSRTQRLHGKALIAMQDENKVLSRINEWLNAVPNQMAFVSIQPNLWPLPASVYDDAPEV